MDYLYLSLCLGRGRGRCVSIPFRPFFLSGGARKLVRFISFFLSFVLSVGWGVRYLRVPFLSFVLSVWGGSLLGNAAI